MSRTLGAERGAMADLLTSSHPYRVAVESSLQTQKPTRRASWKSRPAASGSS